MKGSVTWFSVTTFTQDFNVASVDSLFQTVVQHSEVSLSKRFLVFEAVNHFLISSIINQCV